MRLVALSEASARVHIERTFRGLAIAACISLFLTILFASAQAFGQPIADPEPAKGTQMVLDQYLRDFGQGQAYNWDAFLSEQVATGIAAPAEAPVDPAPAEKTAMAYYEASGSVHGTTTITITEATLHSESKRLGINLSAPTTYESAMIMKNIVENPGFENAVYGMMFHVDDGATGNRIPMAFWDTTWNNVSLGIGHPEGFWDGAEYEIVYGPAKGRSGHVTQFLHENNRNTFYLDNTGVAPGIWDVAIVRTEVPGIASRPDRTTIRPGSPGVQSMKMNAPTYPTQEAFVQYWDTMGRQGDTSAGKLFCVKGEWHIAFWAKANVPDTHVRIRFQRPGEVIFTEKDLTLSTEWTYYEHRFSVADGTDRLTGYSSTNLPPVLMFGFYILDAGTQVWMDDLDISRTDQKNPTAFTDTLVEHLKDLQPGIIRDWSTQLGDTLDNQLAPAFGRKTHDYRPRLSRAGLYTYSLHEFLGLCEEVGAEPWYVIPPTFSPSDLQNLAAYLAAPVSSGHPYALKRASLGRAAPWTSSFTQIHLEFGNEMWGSASGTDPFFGASALGGERLGAVSHDRFAILKASPYFNAQHVHLIVGGQASFPGRQMDIDTYGSNHDEIAIAPYFGTVKDAWTTDEQLFYPLFAKAYYDVTVGNPLLSKQNLDANGKNTSLGIYEVNFHTTGGAATTDVLNDFMTSAAGGLALPLYMLLYQRELGILDQCAFTSLQYSFLAQGYVRIWGTLRDLEATGLKRPTWLGMELANHAIQGRMLQTVFEGDVPKVVQYPINGVPESTEMPLVDAFAFNDGERYSLYITNLSATDPLHIQLNLPFGTGGFATRYTFTPATMRADNEQTEMVRINQDNISDFVSPYVFTLPAHSAYVFRWTKNGSVPSLGVPWWTDR